MQCAGIAAAAVGIAACSGGDGDGLPVVGGPNPGPTDPSADAVTVSGAITFDLVPATVAGLDYDNTVAAPARGVTVELVSNANDILASTVTDSAGQYAFQAPRNTDAFVRAKAELVSSAAPAWEFRVLDNTNANALYVLDGTRFRTGTADLSEDLHAASGWNGSSYSGTRSAAPFAVLDLVYEAATFVIGVDPSVDFPPLDVYWSADNVPELDENGERDVGSGEIGTSFYWPGIGIYLLGAEDIDTEEYDRHVIAHEWGHYFESAFSRSDSIGGPHSLRDQLDLRVAFGEGFGNALSAMVTGDSVYKDISGPRQNGAGRFDVEEGAIFPAPVPGWYSERSVQEILYDLFDDRQDSVEDSLALGFGPIHAVLTTAQRESIALTSIFSFIDALKAALPADAALIDGIVNTQTIDDVMDAYGTGETNAGNPSDPDLILPVYRDIAVGGGAVNVCSTDEYSGATTGGENKLGSRQFLKFSVAAAGTHTFSATATDVPDGQRADPDIVLHQAGPIAVSEGSPDDDLDCSTTTQTFCDETFSLALQAGDYVLEVYEWTNTEPEDSESPPIGRTCFNVEITQ